MSTPATRRLLEASAVLEPADRALLNLWVNRGLDDERLAALTGVDVDAVARRRERIVAALSQELGLPEGEIRAAIAQTDPDGDVPDPPAEVEAGQAQGQPKTEPAESTSSEPAAGAQPERRLRAVPPLPDEPAPAPPAAPEARSRRLWAGILAVLVAIAAITVAIVLLSDGKSHHSADASAAASRTSTPASSASSTAAATATSPTTVASTSTTTGPRAAGTSASKVASHTITGRLAALPGGLTHTTGDIKLSGRAPYLKLKLTVKHLPASKTGHHYEVWLFSSVVNDKRLGVIRPGDSPVTFALPAGARHYHWIDITRQVDGSSAYSGVAELRAHNPVDGPKSVLHSRAARAPKTLTRRAAAKRRHATHRRHAGAHPKRSAKHHGTKP